MSETINILKGIGIFSIMAFHVIGVRGFSIYMLPLFFLLSGYLCSGYVSWWHFIRKKCIRLIVPYLIYGLAFMMLNFLQSGSYPFRSELHNLLIGGQALQGAFGTFWFVNVLFISLLLFNTLLMIEHIWIVMPIVCGVMLTVAMLVNDSGISLPWSLQTVPLALSYMCVGNILRQVMRPQNLDFFVKKLPKWLSICGIVIIILLVIFVPKSMEMDVKYDMYGVPVLSWFLSIVIIVILTFSVQFLNLWGGGKI